MTKLDAEGNKQYITDPIEVAKIHSKPWEAEWGGIPPFLLTKLYPVFQNPTPTNPKRRRRLRPGYDDDGAQGKAGIKAV